MRINCIIVDDEPLARKGMEEYVAATDFLSLKASFGNPMDALKSGLITPDSLLLLDIGMPGVNGLELVKLLNPCPPVIFTTAYPQHAVEGFELNALDYLVKPIPFARFMKAALKARELFSVAPDKAVSADHFFVKVDGRLVKITCDDILYVEALQNYVVIHTELKKYITYLTFRSVEEYLAGHNFLKTHKSYIVAASRIESIEGNIIKIGDAQIPISRTLKDEVMDRILKGKFLHR